MHCNQQNKFLHTHESTTIYCFCGISWLTVSLNPKWREASRSIMWSLTSTNVEWVCCTETPEFKIFLYFSFLKNCKSGNGYKTIFYNHYGFLFFRGNLNERFKATVNPKRSGTYDVTSLKSPWVPLRRRTRHLGRQGCEETCSTNADLARKKTQVTCTTKRDYSLHIWHELNQRVGWQIRMLCSKNLVSERLALNWKIDNSNCMYSAIQM